MKCFMYRTNGVWALLDKGLGLTKALSLKHVIDMKGRLQGKSIGRQDTCELAIA